MSRRLTNAALLAIFLFAFLFITQGCLDALFLPFSITAILPAENGLIGTGRGPLSITFSREPDKVTIYDNIRVEKDSGSSVQVSLVIDGSIVTLVPDQPWEPYQRYWVKVTNGIKDSYGKIIDRAYNSPFQSTSELLPVSATLASPEVIQDVVGSPFTAIELEFSRDVDRNSVEKAFSVSPSAEGWFEWLSEKNFRFHLNAAPAVNAHISVQVSTSALDATGYPIKAFSREFDYLTNAVYPEIETVTAGITPVFDRNDPLTYVRDAGSYLAPKTGDCDMGKEDTLRLTFTKAIDRTTLRDNVQFVPSVTWTENWIDPETVELTVPDRYSLGTGYRVKILTGLKDTDSIPLRSQYTVNLYIQDLLSDFLVPGTTDVLSQTISAELFNQAQPAAAIPGTTFSEALVSGVPTYTVGYPIAVVPAPLYAHLKFTFVFGYQTVSGTPSIDTGTFQNSVSIANVWKPSAGTYVGIMYDVSWLSGSSAKVTFGEMGGGNSIYEITLKGTKSGILDLFKNYLKADIVLRFALRFVGS